jgi:hypothetical protein
LWLIKEKNNGLHQNKNLILSPEEFVKLYINKIQGIESLKTSLKHQKIGLFKVYPILVIQTKKLIVIFCSGKLLD